MNSDPVRVLKAMGLAGADGLLGRSRLAFLVLNVANAVATIVAMLFAGQAGWMLVAPVSAACVLVVAQWWTARGGRSGLTVEAVVAGCMLVASLALPDATMTVSLVFSAVMFRSLYGSHRLAVVRTGAYLGVYAAALVVAADAGRLDSSAASAFVLPLPAVIMTAVTMRILFVAVQARDAAALRQTALAHTATALLGAGDAADVAAIVRRAQRDLLQDLPVEAFVLEQRVIILC